MANKRNKLKEDFKSYLEECNKISYNTSYTNYSDRCDLSFYEWSDLDSTPKKFSSGSEFFKFLDSCKISYVDSQKSEFKTKYILYATCFPDTNILALSNSKVNLTTLINKHKDSVGAIPINDRTYFGVYTSPNSYGCGCYRPYGSHHDFYDDWD